MDYWWVNQKHTNKYEVRGNYLWSPKAKHTKAGKPIRNKSYEYMPMVRPGDVVFGYWSKMVRAVGVATAAAYSSPRPPEFKEAAYEWAEDGWRLPVEFTLLDDPIDPKSYRSEISPHLPRQKGAYSPLHPATLAGRQFLYLAELPRAVGELLLERADEGKRVEEAARLAAASAETPEVLLAEEEVAAASGRWGRSQFGRQSQEERAAIEAHAIEHGTRFLESARGGRWKVRNVSKGNPYDLLCTRGSSKLRVEVKGTTSSGELVVLTRNEVIHCERNSPDVALLVVHGIRLRTDGGLRAEGGSLLLIEAWKTRPEDLQVIGYRYRVPTTAATVTLPVAEIADV